MRGENVTEKREYATLKFVEWQRDRIDAIEHFMENQFYGFFKKRIIDFAKEHDGLTENDIREKLVYKKDDGEINFFDWKMLWNTFQFMKENGEFKEEHRGRGKSIIYRMKEAKL
jgi:hypothetical protein